MPASKPYVLGLTGGIGCGKSAAAEYLSELGAVHIDADGISRALTCENGAALGKIREQFGDEIFHTDGQLDRKKLAAAVFGNVERKRMLESILHPMIQKQIMDEMDDAAEAGKRIVVLDVPLLFESGMDVLCDEVWTVSVPENVQYERVRERDSLSDEEVKKRIDGQMPMDERNSKADHVIDTNKPIEETQATLKKMYNRVISRLK